MELGDGEIVPGTYKESATVLPTKLIGRNQHLLVSWDGGFIDLRNRHIFIVSKLQVVCVYSEKEDWVMTKARRSLGWL